nr:DNA internalization-related competence protein ComEC/Rec2 [Massilia arenosa]
MAILQTAPVLPERVVALALIVLALACVAGARLVPQLRYAWAVAGGLALGYGWAALVAGAVLAHELPKDVEGKDLTIIGTVDSLPYVFDGGVRFDFAVERSEHEVVPPRIVLSWYENMRGAERQLGDVAPGERWRLTVRLQRPHGNANPHGFDYEVWLLEQGLRATGYVRADAANARLDAFVPSPGNFVERTRAWLRERIQRALPEREYAGVIVALVVGDQRAISQSDWKIFNRTGISHLVSISGLHITMVAGLFALAAAALWRRSFFTQAQLPLLVPAQKIAALTGAGVALMYVLLAGFGIPAQRTLYMLAVVAAAVWSGRTTSISHVLAIALGLVVLLDPWAVLASGFWLSFGAVAAILFATSGRVRGARQGWRHALRLAAHTQMAVTLGLVPLTMLLFGQVSVASPIANAVAIPLVSFVVTPLALVGSVAPPLLSDLLLQAAHGCMVALAALLKLISAVPWAVWTARVPEPWAFACAVVGILWLLAPRGWPHRWAGLAACLPLLGAADSRPAPGTVTLTALDVGQGMAMLVETSDHRLLYDTGASYAPGADAGNRVIVPYLRARGIHALDGMVVSHSDTDHSGGALSILDEVRTDWVLSSLPLDYGVPTKTRHHVRCAAGQTWRWDGVQFSILHPAEASYGDAALKSNARSCVLRIVAGDRAVLLAGDIEAPQEAALLANRAEVRADVLLVPHHGSGTSSTTTFLDAVKPSIAVFQLGYRNRYHHPKPEVWNRYGQRGIVRLRSDEAGAITVDIPGAVMTREYRREHPRYWYNG